ncbi:MAG TPA: hypothetical protein VLM85_10145, partial [Polyangiaceae bacterium]|nr:hypothetical protein [Polyangiaceae bacterium]
SFITRGSVISFRPRSINCFFRLMFDHLLRGWRLEGPIVTQRKRGLQPPGVQVHRNIVKMGKKTCVAPAC